MRSVTEFLNELELTLHDGKQSTVAHNFNKIKTTEKIIEILLADTDLKKARSNLVEQTANKLKILMGIKTKKFYTYKCIAPFKFKGSELTPMSSIVTSELGHDNLRKVEPGDLLIVRIDDKEIQETGTIDLQVITGGNILNSDGLDDFRHFTTTPADLAKEFIGGHLTKLK